MEAIRIDSSLCIGCGACESACPFGAISVKDGLACLGEGCRACGSCVEVCPAAAIALNETKAAVDLSDWSGVLVFAQQRGSGLHPITYEMLGKAGELAGKLGEKVYCVAVGHGLELSGLAGCGIERILLFDDPVFSDFKADLFGAAVCRAIELLRPSVVLFGATLEARAVAPYVSVHFRTGLTADCTSLIINDDKTLAQIRPAFGGNIMARIVTTRTRPQMATVRYRVMEPVTPTGDALPPVERLELPGGQSSRVDILQSLELPQSDDISDADLLVAIGRGVRSREDIPIFREFAELLGGRLACSRALVEKGWMPIDAQIGLSGRAVRPKLLITLGISGSVQFRAGITGAERIIAVNEDPGADIFSVAHWSLTADIYELIPALTERLKVPN